jgi:hypothetical protein
MPGSGRSRLPRLGVVDAFDLDRQRQLVIVRRDNVEHLIMIGGPNDLVIESQIIRAEAREARIRDKEPKEPAPVPAGAVWPPELDAALRPASTPAAPQRKTQLPSAGFGPRDAEPAAVAAGFDAPIAPASPGPAPPPRQPVFPLPPRRSPPAFTLPPQRPPAQREPPLGRSETAQKEPAPRERADVGANSPGGFPRSAPATAFLRSPPPRPGQESAAKRAVPPNAAAEAASSALQAAAPPPSAFSEPAAAAPEAVRTPAATEPEASALLQASIAVALAPSRGSAPAPTQDPLDSIEAEMAKLLGRGGPDD